ncbi:MAG: Hsp20/alpha crystallin family protein [bacterium]
MEETTQEFYKDRVQAQENRILELQQRNKDSNINEQSIDLDYDLYLEHEYLFLNVNLPGVLKQELKVELNQGEIIISGEFPNLCADEEVEFLERKRPSGYFQKKFLLPQDLLIQKHEWQLVDGVLQIRMILKADQKDSKLLLD